MQMEEKLKEFFGNKKVLLMGLGLLGRGVGDALFISKYCKELLITDLKTEEQLKDSLSKLKNINNLKFRLGEHKEDDFKNADIIIKSAGVPMDSIYIKIAKENNIPVYMSTAIFAKFAIESGVKIIGITGTRGKTTTTYLIYEILKKASLKSKVYLGGNIKGISTISLLNEIKSGDIVVLELDSWQLQGFGDLKISPNISVFTTFFDDHLNYYKNDRDLYFNDKANIFRNHKDNDVLIVGEKIADKFSDTKNKIIAKISDIPDNWKLKILGEHNRANASCAVNVARYLNISEDKIKKAVCNFKGVEGRCELIRNYKGIKIYNDTTATTPDATVSALRALNSKSEARNPKQKINSKIMENSKHKKNIILIMGGADKNLDMSELLNEIPKYCKELIMLDGSGTERIFNYQLPIFNQFTQPKADQSFGWKSLKGAVDMALSKAKRGDIVLFSPAFASFGMFKNEYDRGEQFVKIIKKL